MFGGILSCLPLICLVVVVNSQNLQNPNNNVPVNGQPPQQQQAQQPNAQQQNINSMKLVQRQECHSDIKQYCGHIIEKLLPNEVLSDIVALQCLQDSTYGHETLNLQPACGQLVWQYKLELTQGPTFISEFHRYCADEIQKNPSINECAKDTRPGYTLSCMLDFMFQLKPNTQCMKFTRDIATLAFSDFQLVASFVENCNEAITALHCGSLNKLAMDQSLRWQHSQSATLNCLMIKRNNFENDPEIAKIVKNIPEKCNKEILRLSELQVDDFHLNRPLYFACRNDREKFCGNLPAGDKKILYCLLEHRDEKDMHQDCAKMLADHATYLGNDYRLAHPLINSCNNEMKSYQCFPQVGFERSLYFHLSWVLLCLEQANHVYTARQNEQKQPGAIQLMPFSRECLGELKKHRQIMVSNFRMSPELVYECTVDINKFCSPRFDIEENTVHCLMSHAKERDEQRRITDQCRNSLQNFLRTVDIGQNYRVDKVLYASCKPLIEGKCKMDIISEMQTLRCLVEHVDQPDMTQSCQDRLIEIQYFMARDWTLDTELYNACHKVAIERCSAVDNWHALSERNDNHVDPGPQVLACLYRTAYDEEEPINDSCKSNIYRVLRERAVRVNLLPEIENYCRNALFEYCSTNVKPSEEMECLQKVFEEENFKSRHKDCYKAVFQFTKMEAKDIRLNRHLMDSCQPVIHTYCKEVSDNEIDHGAVMECLLKHKKVNEMTKDCKSYVNHFQLLTLRDYHLSYQFNEACKSDIQQYCSVHQNDKADIIRCLSTIVLEHELFGEKRDLRKECKQQLRDAYLQQEQVDFDDKSHLADADPEFSRKCASDLKRLNCNNRESDFEGLVACLRVDYENLDPGCKAVIFERQKMEAIDNTFDNELQTSCRFDIDKFCKNQQGEKVLDCLMNTKIVRLLQKGCQRVVQERMLERVRDDRLNPGLLIACKRDAQEYCAEDYRKVSDPRYEKQQLGSIIASCLRSKFAQLNNNVRLTPECKDEVSKVILESEFDIQLDPALYKACRSIINRHCSNAILQRGGNFDNVLECLKADFYTGQLTDRDCAQQLARRTQESLVDIHLDPGLHEACSVDIQRICKDIPPGQSRIVMCLMDALQVHQITMSAGCRTKLSERQRLWNIAHDQYKMVLPVSWSTFYNVISEHPQRSWILTYTGLFLFVLLLVGCICGRVTKRTYSELKNR